MTINDKFVFALPIDNDEFKFVVGIDNSEIMFSSDPARGFEFRHFDLAMKHLSELKKINPNIRMFVRKITLDEI